MRETGSPHHLCLHLCYYREYDAARQLFVLRTRVAAAKGTASALNDWRADVRAATAEEMGLTDARRRERRRRRKRSRADADDDDDAVGADGDDSYSEDDSSLPRDARRGAGAREGGWLASKSLPWRVVFFSPEGDAFDRRRCWPQSAPTPPSRARRRQRKRRGGFGNETLADFQTNVAGSSPGSGLRPPTRRAGRVAPPREPRGSRSPAPGERTAVRAFASRGRRKQSRRRHGLLRAALWPKRNTPRSERNPCGGGSRRRRRALRGPFRPRRIRSPPRVDRARSTGERETRVPGR